MKYIIITITILTFYACSPGPDNSSIFTVEHKGALKNMMHKGDLSAKANLVDFKDKEHLYALGAIKDLKGEVFIFDSKPYMSSVQGDDIFISNTFEHEACLFVYTSVEKWVSFDIPSSVSSYEDMENYIEETAENNGINTGEPFPFLMEGVAKSFDWHIINWKDGDTEHSHEKHIQSGMHGTLTDQNIDILGFYSDSHKGIFTHHTINTHLHFKLKNDTNTGHIDDLTLGTGMILKLPDVSKVN